MKINMKNLSNLEIIDFSSNPVWEFILDSDHDIDYDNVIPVRQESIVFDSDVGVMVLIDGILKMEILLKE